MMFTIFFSNLQYLQGIFMIFSISFIIDTCNATSLAENNTKMAENLKKKLDAAAPVEPAF